MAEEFQESELIFQHYESGSEGSNDEQDSPETAMRNQKPRRKKLRTKRSTSSLPVNIPENSSWFQNAGSDYFTDDDDGGAAGHGEMEPPHVIIGRRIAGRVMAFSVCTGNGRTLKGRDLRKVRTSILRMTGFLET